jgi:hypothetical protein
VKQDAVSALIYPLALCVLVGGKFNWLAAILNTNVPSSYRYHRESILKSTNPSVKDIQRYSLASLYPLPMCMIPLCSIHRDNI